MEDLYAHLAALAEGSRQKKDKAGAVKLLTAALERDGNGEKFEKEVRDLLDALKSVRASRWAKPTTAWYWVQIRAAAVRPYF